MKNLPENPRIPQNWEFLVSIVSLFLGLMFLPGSGWVDLFAGSNPAALYSELSLDSVGRSFLVTKNSLSTPVKLEDIDVRGNWVKSIHSEETYSLGERGEILPQTYGVVEIWKQSTDSRRSNGEIIFEPGELTILNPGEILRACFQFLVIAVFLGVLSFFCALAFGTANSH